MKILSGVLCMLLLAKETSAFYGIAGCPKNYPKVSTPYGPTGAVANGYYYLHTIDYGWAQMLLKAVPPAYRPTGGR
jgi:hypothetical protein